MNGLLRLRMTRKEDTGRLSPWPWPRGFGDLLEIWRRVVDDLSFPVSDFEGRGRVVWTMRRVSEL